MLRRVQLACVLAGLLAACGGSRERGPAWPAPSPSETDGGESLAPRQAGSIAAIEKAEDARPAADDDDDDDAEAPADAAAPAAAPAASSESTEATPASEPEVLTTEELIIEIED
jgi:hypothetical protein